MRGAHVPLLLLTTAITKLKVLFLGIHHQELIAAVKLICRQDCNRRSCHPAFLQLAADMIHNSIN
jgi:hypothetical protein